MRKEKAIKTNYHTESYLQKRLEELSIKSIDSPQTDLHHIPSSANENIFPKLFFIRDLIGRVEGFRLFNTYFDDLHKAFFNESGELNKERLELLAATINHEPYLIDTIVHLFPDIYLELKQWINHSVINDAKTTLKWNSYGLILFYTIINHKEFYFKDNISAILKKLSSDVESSMFCLDFISYKLWQNYIELPSQSKQPLSLDTIHYLQQNKEKFGNYITDIIKGITKLRIYIEKDIHSVPDAFINLWNFFDDDRSLANHSITYLSFLNIEATLKYPFRGEVIKDPFKDEYAVSRNKASAKFESLTLDIDNIFNSIRENIIANLEYILTIFDLSSVNPDYQIEANLRNFRSFISDFNKLEAKYTKDFLSKKLLIIDSLSVHKSQEEFREKFNLFFQYLLRDDKLPKWVKYGAKYGQSFLEVFHNDTVNFTISSIIKSELVQDQNSVSIHPAFLKYVLTQIKTNMTQIAKQNNIIISLNIKLGYSKKYGYMEIKQNISMSEHFKNNLTTHSGGLKSINYIINLFNGTFEISNSIDSSASFKIRLNKL